MVIFFLGGAHPGPGRQKKLNFEATKLDRYVIPETRRVGHTPLAFLRVIGLATTMMTLGFFVVLPVVSVGVLLKKDPSRKWVSWWKRWREEGSELKIRFHKFKGGCSWKRWWIVFFLGGEEDIGGCFKNVSSFYTVQKWHVMCHLLQTTWRKKSPGSGHVVGVFNTEYSPWLQPTTLARSSRSKTSSISIGLDFLSLLFWKASLFRKKQLEIRILSRTVISLV